MLSRRQKESVNKTKEGGDAAVASDAYESSDALVASSMDSRSEWVMDSGCSFYMSPNKKWFEDLELQNGGIVLLGNITMENCWIWV